MSVCSGIVKTRKSGEVLPKPHDRRLKIHILRVTRRFAISLHHVEDEAGEWLRIEIGGLVGHAVTDPRDVLDRGNLGGI